MSRKFRRRSAVALAIATALALTAPLGRAYALSQSVEDEIHRAEQFQQQQWEELQRRGKAERQKQHEQRAATVRSEGYEPMSIKDFVLDGNQLAKEEARVAFERAYVRYGNIGMLYASIDDALMARTRNSDPPRVPLLLEDADRELRKSILECEASGYFGCPIVSQRHGHDL